MGLLETIVIISGVLILTGISIRYICLKDHLEKKLKERFPEVLAENAQIIVAQEV